MALEKLNKGDKVDVHLTLYTEEVRVLDTVCKKYGCSRAAVIGAWAEEYLSVNLKKRVSPGRRPGAGRKRKEATA